MGKTLLRSNLGRRWIERIKEEGAIPRQIGNFVNRFKTMVKDAEVNAIVRVEEIVSLIMRASLKSGYQLKVIRKGS